MNRQQICLITLRALFLSSALASGVVDAKGLYLPLTPLEQMSTLSSATNYAVLDKLFRARPETINSRPAIQQDYGTKFQTATLVERLGYAQKIGEEGVEQFAENEKLKPHLSPKGRAIPTGPDSSYWNPKSGKLYVLEAKGGTSAKKWTYNSLQGTNTNTIRSAEGSLRRSKTIPSEQLKMARIIKAAQKGHLTTGVVRTEHVRGTPRTPRLIGYLNTDKVAREAKKIERELIKRHPELRKVFMAANFLHKVDRVKYHVARRLSGFCCPTGRPIRPSRIRPSAPQQAGLRSIGLAGARWLPPLAVGVGGVAIVTAYYQFASGLTSPREFYRGSAGPTILVAFTATGALVGSFAFGVGAVAGGSIGAMAALPVEIAADWVIDRHYRDFDTRQRRLVDAAVEEFYGVDATLVEDS